MVPLVTLQPFKESHLKLLAAWLKQPHVARWFPTPEEDLAWATNPSAGGSQAIIASGAAEVGYLRWQRVDRDTLDSFGLQEIPANSVDADILLGEVGSVGKGIGPSALMVLAHKIREEGDVPLIGLTTELENTRAHRAFEKAGFRITRQYDTGKVGVCHLMILDLRAKRVGTAKI